ncbi:hypothetical protein IAR50_003978 [Cryptococcus sp. DSM 104548]
MPPQDPGSPLRPKPPAITLAQTDTHSESNDSAHGSPDSRELTRFRLSALHSPKRNHVRIQSEDTAARSPSERDQADQDYRTHTKRPSFAMTVDDKEVSQNGRKRRLADATGEQTTKSWSERLAILGKLRAQKIAEHRWFKWIGPKLTWGKCKPVVRSAISSWLGLVLIVIVPVERVIGTGSFFILIVGFMMPPYEPVVQTLEKYINLFFFAAMSWVWVIIAIAIAGATRGPPNLDKLAKAEAKWGYLKESNPTKYQQRIIFDGTYLQAKPAVVCAVFLAAGTGALLWWKLRTSPSPATFPLVLSCILIDVSLTTAVFYPTNPYNIGLIFFLPMAVQAGLGTLCSILIFPESVGHSFQSKFGGVLGPLASAMKSIDELFSEAEDVIDDTEDDDFLSVRDTQVKPQNFTDRLESWAARCKGIRAKLLQSLAGLPPLRAQQRYLSVDISYSRLSGEDLRNLFDRLAILQARSGGMAFFFDVIITNAKHSHLDSSAWSVNQVAQSRPGSRATSIRNESLDERHDHNEYEVHDGGAATPPLEAEDSAEDAHDRNPYFGSKRFSMPGILRRSGSPHGITNSHKGSHLSLLDHLRKSQQPVGIYESTRYMDIERNFAVDTAQVLEQLDILARGCVPVIRGCQHALTKASEWISPKSHRQCAVDDALSQVIVALQGALDDFQTSRLQIVQPYKHLFDPNYPTETGLRGKMHFRGLFQNFVAQYHLIEFSTALLALLRMMEDLDKMRPDRRLWYPRISSMLSHLRHSQKEKHLTEGDEEGHDNDAAFNRDEDELLGEAKTRNPEYKPFDSPWLNLVARAVKVLDVFESRSSMFAVKAAMLGALTTLPNFIASSASFYYFNRGVWCTIMAQLTLAVYSGDTATAWLSRVVASFWGCVLGMVIWYISSGHGQGNPYGVAAACAVVFPVAAFFRVHFPGPVLTAVMLPVTMGLVIGYSYYNGTIGPLTHAEWGWDVAWRRFLCVLIGISAAWAFSYGKPNHARRKLMVVVPPVYSAKRAIRYSYARTIGITGSILCEILSHANDPHYHLKEDDEIRKQLIAWRSKLNKLGARHINATREKSLRGKWPEERYKALFETLQDTLSLLSQLNHVLTQLDRPWRKALLDRTRLSDPVFLGDVLVVLSMCSTALRAGSSLPQITPSPLVARFRMGKTKGLDLPLDPTDQSNELPSLVTVDVLESENYMRYALGITTTFSLVSRLDRIVVICKTLLGENYHIAGLHLEQTARV